MLTVVIHVYPSKVRAYLRCNQNYSC